MANDCLEEMHEASVVCDIQQDARVEPQAEVERLRAAVKGIVDYYDLLIPNPTVSTEMSRLIDAGRRELKCKSHKKRLKERRDYWQTGYRTVYDDCARLNAVVERLKELERYQGCDGCSTGDCPHDSMVDCIKDQAKHFAIECKAHADSRAEVERLRAHLRDYGCHAARCDHLISDPHGCSCGWKDVRAALDREATE